MSDTSPKPVPQITSWCQAQLNQLRRIIFPDLCLGCNAMVDAQGTLCPQCWGRLIFLEKPYCAVTGMPFQHDFGENAVSAEAIANPPAFTKARAATVHHGLARKLVTKSKYADRTDLAPWMANWMIRAGSELIKECDYITPLPLHPRRYWQRRYNQSAELARPIAKIGGKPLRSDIVLRIKATRQQVGLSAQDRHKNVRGAFQVPDDKWPDIQNKNILLIDDVFTTGATVNAAAKTLVKAGAATVNVLTFSKVVPWMIDRQDFRV